MASIHSFVLLMLMIFIFLPLGNVKIHSMVGLLDLENVPDDMRFKYEIIDTIEVFSFVLKIIHMRII